MKNQLAFTTLGCPKWNFEKIVAEASRMGYSAIEIRGVGEYMATETLPCLLPENEQATKALLEKHGIQICGVGTSASFHNPDQIEKALEEGKTAIDICQRMGIPTIRVFGDKLEGGLEETVNRVADALDVLCAYSEDHGCVQVLLEIHGDFNTVETIAPLLQRMEKHPSFGILWDVEHSFRAYGEDFTRFYELIRPWIRHTHIKDCVMEGTEAIIRLPGQGAINLEQIIQRLKQDGYEGLYSFEWEKRWHPEIEEPEIAFVQYASCMKQWLGEK